MIINFMKAVSMISRKLPTKHGNIQGQALDSLSALTLSFHRLVPDGCLWLGPPSFNLRKLSLSLAIRESSALFYVSSRCVNLIRLHLCDDTLQ